MAVWEVGAQLAECPYWLADEQALLWIDIVRPSINILAPAAGISVETILPARIGSAVPAGAGSMLLALEDGLWLRDGQGTLRPCASPDMTGVHFNDGKCDPAGRFWVGSRSSDGSPGKGKLHTLDPDGMLREAADGFDVCNGLGWSPDGSAFYLVDTIPRNLYRFDFDCRTGQISGKTVLRRFDESEGKPDGLAVDASGNLWCAMWDGGGIRILSPGGEDLGWLPTPCPRPTSCAFGGPSGDVLFVTSASIGVDRSAFGASGSIMAFCTATAGVPVRGYGARRA